MMKPKYLIGLAAMALLSACSAAGEVEVHESWARPAAMGGNGAVYFLLHNHTLQDDELTGASSDAAEAVEIHETRAGQNDTMQMMMRPSIPLPAGEELKFEPGGYHLMLVGLKQDLNVGDEFKVTLHFKNHADIVMTVRVQESDGMDMDHPAP